MLKGLIIKSTGSWYTVLDNTGKSFLCKIKGSFRIKGGKNTNPITVGDKVEFDPESRLIIKVEERKNYIIRKPSNLSKQYHIIAANIDQAILLVTIGFPDTPNEFIDRFLVTAEAYNIPAILVFNKIDLYTGLILDALNDLESIYKPLYPCYRTSVKKNLGIESISALLISKTTLITGISGTGKSSLINRLEPGLNLKTSEISEYHLQGKHITTFYEMFPLSMGGFLIDTPGIRGFGLVDMKREEISHYFPEIFQTSRNCEYYNCLHLNEPGCAVKEAWENGTIHPSRYRSYQSIMNQSEAKYR